MDLGPTRTDFNLGTPRFEISNHSLTTDHRLCDSHNTYTINKTEATFKNTTTNTVLHNFGVVHNLPNSLLKSFRVVNKYNSKHSPKHVSI